MTKHHWHSPESRPEKSGYFFRYYGNAKADLEPDMYSAQESQWYVKDGGEWVPSNWMLRWREGDLS